MKNEIINIKRTTLDGLIDCSGIFFEIKGFQFCFTKIKGGLFLTIEISTGANFKTFDNDIYTKKEALFLSKYEIEKKTQIEIEKAVKKFKKSHSQFTYPINKFLQNDK